MLKVLLIDLGSNRDELNEPLGIESIAGTLSNNIKHIQIDFRWGQIESLEVYNIKNQYNIIGISAKLGTFEQLITILNILERERNDNKVVIGGPLATFGYIELINLFNDIICIRGEGESSFLNICQKLIIVKDTKQIDFLSIPNIAIKKNGTIQSTPRSIIDLNTINHPFRYYLHETIQQKGIVRIESSRGCSWSKCAFCSVCEHYGSKKWRPFPIDFIIKELEILSTAGCLSPYFTDEDFFGGDYLRSEKLANEIIEAKKRKKINPNMSFFFSSRINDLLHPQGTNLLKLWKKAGLRELFIGLESGVQKQLKRYGKSATPSTNSKVIKKIKSLDIQLDIGYILFEPEMSFNELIENIDYIEQEDLSRHDSRALKLLRAQPFTTLTNYYIKKKIITGSMHVDLLCYPLKYNDIRVSETMNIFYEWESKYKDIVYLIQSTCRGEVPSEKYRLVQKERLSAIRRIDFDVLKRIIDNIKKELSNKELISYITEQEQLKSIIIQDFIKNS
jgi:radical SAM superfamily enzyme YgiQ (UPF0313 family)